MREDKEGEEEQADYGGGDEEDVEVVEEKVVEEEEERVVGTDKTLSQKGLRRQKSAPGTFPAPRKWKDMQKQHHWPGVEGHSGI